MLRRTPHFWLALTGALIGAPLSFLLALAGPRLLNLSNFTITCGDWDAKWTSPLVTVYTGGMAIVTPSDTARLQELRTHDYVVSNRPDGFPAPTVPLLWNSTMCATVLVDSGFPFRSLCAWSSNADPCYGERFSHSSGYTALHPAEGDAISQHWTPNVPIWSGLIANAAVWSLGGWGLCWTLFAAGSAARRAWRKRHQLCGRCGYPRSGLAAAAACPECGRP